MAQLIDLPTFGSEAGNLTVLEKVMPGAIRRVFYIYGVDAAQRAGHRHQTAWHAMICLSGSCRVYCNNGDDESFAVLDNPRKCLVIEPRDWHLMEQFSSGTILLVLSNEYYDPADYIYERYSLQTV
ncbi:sugar 3,4-ketoisomerase [Larkinella insperata]|uniref:Sugar 3,4-ketoisomerase n=1 Tax=Larkinella insperata TaxID=332158 RepID=A0ABW3QGD1_9BACT|nr:FdtA/QdtA family cupin domain-containing protein [Larkinella insperata]